MQSAGLANIRIVILATAFACAITGGVCAQCVNGHYASAPPRMPSGSGCLYGTTPQQIAVCQQQEARERAERQAYAQSVWDQWERECQRQQRIQDNTQLQQRQQADAERRAAAQHAADEAQRQRAAADTARYVAEQKAQQAAADRDRQRAIVEEADARRLAAEADARRAAAESQRKWAIVTAAFASLIPGGPATIPAKWAWALILIPIGISTRRISQKDLPKAVKIGILVAVPVATGLIGMAMGFTNEVTLWDMALLSVPGGAGLFVSVSVRA